ncbi:restriction endonuclease [Anaerocolumna aminovalerica]|uniref:restriction endonuclease n=1 Tax=Anaerocolumna aminovalerica TaxID=1527 RepID=UPI000B8945AB
MGVQLVRSLLGVQSDRKANKAVLVTSSSFTKDARKFAERQQHLISLVDFNDLLQMMQQQG